MKLQDLLESDLNISITITIKELKEFADYLLQQSKDDIERLILGKHPIKYTLYFHKIENSISTLVKS